jgi:hypothetical protein
MMTKKSQATLFIIIGILVLLIAGISVFYVQRYTPREKEETAHVQMAKLEKGSIQYYMTDCLKQIGRRGAYRIGLNGGYLNAEGDIKYGEEGDRMPAHYYLEQSVLPYAVDSSQNKLRSLTEMERVLSNYVLAEFPAVCNLSGFENRGYDIKLPKNPNATVIIGKSTVSIKLSYPVVFERQDDTISFGEITAAVPVRLGMIYEKAVLLVNRVINSRDLYNIKNDCADYSADDRLLNLYLDSNIYSQTYAVKFVDAQPVLKYGEVPFRFQFAVKNKKLTGECAG